MVEVAKKISSPTDGRRFLRFSVAKLPAKAQAAAMEPSLARSRLRASRSTDNQRLLEDASVLCSSMSSTPEDRGRDILLHLLKQISEFLERKEMMSSRVAASKEWRKSRSRRRSESSTNLFEVVIQVCEQRTRRLQRSVSCAGRDQQEWGGQTPRMLVAEAIVQELLVSLMELRMKEKEALVLEEAENVEIMRQLHVHLQKDEELVRGCVLNLRGCRLSSSWVEPQVRNKVCVGAGDEQQLEELQLMLRTDFLEEVAGAESPQKQQQQADSATTNEASLQFAWETIDDQKKEIIRLRAENEELKRQDGSFDAASALRASMVDDEPSRVLNLLRSQLSSHHDKNLTVLHDHIQRLEKALQTATAASRKARRGWDGSRSTFTSSGTSDKEDWCAQLSRSAIGTDFSRTQGPRTKCGECRKSSASLLALRSEVKQLRAHATTDEESLLQAEKDRGQLQRENSALSTALLSAKQKQEELRQMILELTQEKHQLQNLGDSEQRTAERSLRELKEQLEAVEEQKAHLRRKFDALASSHDAEVSSKRTLAKEHEALQDTHAKLLQSTTELQRQVASLDEAARRCEATVEARDSALKDLQTRLESMEHDGTSRATELLAKDAAIAETRAQLSDLQRSFDSLEVEKRRTTGEIDRLLQTLDECKRKNQRLEQGFEELKQGKELLASLQKVERGASAIQSSDLQQAREQLEALKLQLSASKAECSRLEQDLKASGSTTRQYAQELKRARHELEAQKQRCLMLEEQVSEQQALQSVLKRENGERIDALSQELAESKTAMLMWMNKFNAVSDDKQQLENEQQSLAEDHYSLQRMVEELQAEREEAALGQQLKAQRETELREEVSALNETQRALERERRVADQEKKALVKLVQTLQARPELQQRAFHEMLKTCQRGTERTLCELSDKVTATLEKLGAVEERYHTLKAFVARRKQLQGVVQDEDSSSDESGCQVVPKPTSPEILVQEDGFLSSSTSAFALSSSQPAWLEAIAPLDVAASHSRKNTAHQRNREKESDTGAREALEGDLKRWKWKYFVQCLATNSSNQQNAALATKLSELSRTREQLKEENLQRSKLHHLSVVVVRQLFKELALSQQALRFASWKNQAHVKRYQAKLHASAKDPTFAPTTTMALANCIQLVRTFCEPPRKEAKAVPERVRPSRAHGAGELTGYLVEINSKVASWKVAVDRKIAEYAERNKQLKAVQRRCAELKDLVGLNQRLIEEMERRAAGQQSVVEAAWDFATAYKALSPSARAQVFQSRDLLSASKGIVEGLTSLGVPRSMSKLSQTIGAGHRSLSRKQDETASSKRGNFLSASAAPGISSATTSRVAQATDKSREKLNDSNIELLEDAVGSLKGAMHKQRSLKRELKEKDRTLTVTTKELEKRTLQFLLLRSFLQWKCASRKRKSRSQPASRA
jgi:hypothetical protein